MEDYYPYLRLSRVISYIASDLAVVAGVIIDFSSLRYAGILPTFWLIVLLALPFVAAVGVRGIGDLFDMLLQVEPHASENTEIHEKITGPYWPIHPTNKGASAQDSAK